MANVSVKDNFMKGIIKQNPVFVFLLGMCPTLAVTTTVETALGMGLLVIFVTAASNVVVSLVKSFIPDEVRIPSYIVIIATFVTIVEMLTNAYAPALAESLGVFIPLIVVNCIILGRAESFASKNNVFDSLIDGLGMGAGFTLAVMLIGFIREILATGQIAYGVYLPLPVTGSINVINVVISKLSGIEVDKVPDYWAKVMSMPPGAFITLGALLAFFNYLGNRKKEKLKARAVAEGKVKA
jgi:electron transport complex protein RnfE